MPYAHLEYVFRILGINTGTIGAKYLRSLYYKELSPSDLSDNQIEQVLDTWNSRHFVPPELADRYVPINPKSDDSIPEREYNLLYIDAIISFLRETAQKN